MKTSFALLLALAMLVLGSACDHPARIAYARQMNCPIQETMVKATRQPGHYLVRGCDKMEEYYCKGGVCQKLEPSWIGSAPRVAPVSERSSDVVQKQRHRDGYDLYTVHVRPRSEGFEVVAGSAPARAKEHVLMRFNILARKFKEEPEACDVRLLLDLERVALEEPVRKDDKKDRVWELKVPFDTAVAIVSAKRATWRVCGGTWNMADHERERLAMLLARLRETVAWDETPRTVGRMAKAPVGGWPAWSKVLEAAPAADTTSELDGTLIYERLKASVYPVHVEAGQSKVLGSAVAISKALLMTNCHVVDGASTVTVGSGDKKLRAKVIKAHPKTDRCALEVTGGEVVPIAGVRGHKDLKVGERAYTLGSPAGFENTLGEGLVSGLREEQGLHYVQTSAPISSGSSGGALFDRHGNLIGITTLVYVGGDGNVTQSLNFAIAADEFFAD
jgi:S1-C subfamily serine protease